MIATARTVCLRGPIGHLVEVQVDVGRGTVATVMVGRADASVAEARERCRAAVENSGYDWPATRKVTILLSPADLPKSGSHLDLAIAVGVLAAASPEIPADALAGVVLLGELSLDGGLRCVPGLLPMVLAASASGIGRVLVPEPQAEEAALVPGMEVVGVRSLAQALAVLVGAEPPEAPPVPRGGAEPLLSWRGQGRLEEVDLADVLGMAEARFALEVAAAGGHSLLLLGPKGAGKTTLAERLPTILPDLAAEERLEVAVVESLCGSVLGSDPCSRPPFRAPHHTVSRAGLLGGGSGRVRPGEISRAHRGVLFLDEFPLLAADIIEALRQPLESGEVTIARGEDEATFPAGGLAVLAANPCPCGEFHPGRRDHACVCSEVRRRDYRRKLSGPIADRIDITRTVEPLAPHERADPLAHPESSAQVRARVTRARSRQRTRYGWGGWQLNAFVPGPVLRERWPLLPEAAALLEDAVRDGRLTRRGATRVHRVAWSLADLAERDRPGPEELAVALRLRLGEPLPLAVLERPR